LTPFVNYENLLFILPTVQNSILIKFSQNSHQLLYNWKISYIIKIS